MQTSVVAGGDTQPCDASSTDKIVGLTGTLLGGYEWGTTGRSAFIQDYGVLETITKIEPADNACSKARAMSGWFDYMRTKPLGSSEARLRLARKPKWRCLPSF